jgi:hypothetical protein
MKVLGFFAVALALSGCHRDAIVASHNLSKEADMFRIDRRVVFYNGITGEYILKVEGKCSVEDIGTTISFICKTGPEKYKKHMLGKSDNVTYFSEQLESKGVSTYRYSVVFKPSVIIPDVEVKL